MLPARHRLALRQHPDFFVQAQRYTSRSLVAYVLQTEVFQGAVVVPKKVSTLATDRHTLKRRLHNLLYQLRETQAYCLTLVVKPGALNRTNLELESELNQLMKDINRRTV